MLTFLKPHQFRQRGAETVLLVEDDNGVRKVCRQVLQGQGYQVVDARSVEEATQKCQQTGPIHLLLSDVVPPGGGACHLTARLRELNPAMGVIYIFNYVDDEVVQCVIIHDRAHFLQKPFSPRTLTEKVREVLDSCWNELERS